ncbi:MAG: protein yeeN [Gemmatimonadetes bacterium]|jgi:YebC/PmpR family DNA-binding regulatory protein|nr:protein yeeN [Gemmatimonadota bacterium]
MAGHSKWKNIKHYKAVTDAKRGILFTKLIREIMMAAKLGGADPSANARLRLAIDAARSKSLPKDNIERAIKKGAGTLEGEAIQEVTYEGYGPGGVALIIDCMTDNPTRTVADVRHKMSRAGGNLGTPGSVSFMFEKKGLLQIDAAAHPDEDAMLELALEAGAEDFRREDDVYVVTTDPASFHAVQAALEARKVIPVESELAMVPKNTVAVSGRENVATLLKLIDTLEELDDVQKVWGNFDIDDADLEDL